MDPSEEDKRLLYKVHVNMGHPEVRRFCRVLRAGGVSRHVIRWARNSFHCAECEEHRQAGNHRR
eukprot:4796285-Pyramimonas_sp.AAC.1